MDIQDLTSNLTYSTSGPPLSGSLNSWTLATIVLTCLCFLVGVPGNLAVLILKPNWQKLSSMTQCLMMNLAVSDLLLLLILPVWICQVLYSWEIGDVACKILAFFVGCNISSSILTVTALSIQRYIQVVHKYKCVQFKKWLLLLLWMISATLSVTDLVLGQTVHDPHQQRTFCISVYSSVTQLVAVSLTESIVGFSSFSIIAFTYISLNRKLSKAVLFSSSWTSKLVTSITVTFFVLYMPYCIFNVVVVAVAGISIENELIIQRLYDWKYLMGSVTFINSCLNPLLYAFAIRICGQGNNNTSEDIADTAVTNDETV